MNDGSEREIFNEDLLLERLVDGELTDAEYRRLLAHLDQRPDGWRRCAMAFLEDQAWGRELSGARRQLDEPVVKASPKSRIRSAWNFGGILAMACAASFLLAYFVATSVMQFQNSRVVPTSDLLTNAAPRGKSAPGQSAASNLENVNPPLGAYEIAGDGSSNQIQMPILAADDPRARLLMNEHASMPLEVMRDLQQSGYQVNRQRQWAVGEDAGNSVMVPIEELEIIPISGRSFQ
jgi:hypothetical protein